MIQSITVRTIGQSWAQSSFLNDCSAFLVTVAGIHFPTSLETYEGHFYALSCLAASWSESLGERTSAFESEALAWILDAAVFGLVK